LGLVTICALTIVCWEKCREGYKNIGTSCKKDHCFSKRGIRNIFRKIGNGIKDIVTCFYTKHTYGRTAGKILECEEDHEKKAGLCYPNCRDHYNGVGPGLLFIMLVCWGQCSGSTPHRCAIGWFVTNNDSAASKSACKKHLKAQFAAVGVLAINIAVIAASAVLIAGTFGAAAPAVIALDSVCINLTLRDC
jgi:hypothetical protein